MVEAVRIGGEELRVSVMGTNIFGKIEGRWLMVHIMLQGRRNRARWLRLSVNRNFKPANCSFANVLDEQPVSRVRRALPAGALGVGSGLQRHGAPSTSASRSSQSCSMKSVAAMQEGGSAATSSCRPRSSPYAPSLNASAVAFN